MPNYVRNIIKMEGITTLSLFSEIEGKKTFDFNKIIPMPKSLDMQEGTMVDDCVIYYLTDRCTIPINRISEEKRKIIDKLIKSHIYGSKKWIQDVFVRVMELAFDESESKRKKMYEDGKTYVENIQNYGHATWYKWRIENWDTKWNAGDYEEIDKDTIRFDTAWSCPEKIILALTKMYPNIAIKHWWADEDIGNNSGYRKYKYGEIIYENYNESNSQYAYETYIKCWGATNCLYKDEDGLWQCRNCDECSGCD